MSETVELEIKHLEVGYVRKAILPEINGTIQRGELWALVGPNGAGKTTLLRTILGLLPPIAGKVVRDESRLAYVPQRSGLRSGTPARVIDLVRAGADRGWSFLDPTYTFRRREAVRRALEVTDTYELRKKPYGELSEGQKQRVLIARALTSTPSLLILDEPTSAMDLAAERNLMELLATLRREQELAILIVSHHLPVVMKYATHAIVVDRVKRSVTSGPINEVIEDPFLRQHATSQMSQVVS